MDKKALLLTWLILTSFFSVSAATDALYVGESMWIDGPSVVGRIDAISWYSDHSNQISIDGNSSGASIVIQSYFSGTAKIECQYGYTYYVGSTKYHQTGHDYFYVSCRKSTVTLNQKQIEIAPGQEVTLSYTNSSGFKLPFVHWESKNSEIATVNDSYRALDVHTVTVKGVKSGKTNIILYANTGGENPVCEVTVKDIPATSISLSPNKLSIREGKYGYFTYTLTPKNSSTTVTWSSDNPSVATVNSTSGSITAKSKGTATITATTSNGLKASAKVEVVSAPTDVKISDARIISGFSMKLKPQLTPANSSATYRWESSDKSVVTVDSSGNLTGKNVGSATVTVTTDNGLKAEAEVTVVRAAEGRDARNIKTRIQTVKDLVNKTINN